MALKSRHCPICRRVFAPDPRTPKQRVCSAPRCQRERKRRAWRRLMASRSKSLERHRKQTRLWAQARGYWKEYRRRQRSAAYKEREIQRMRRKRRSLDRVAKQVLIKAGYLERLDNIQAMGLEAKTVAKQVLIHRRVNALVECLIWHERVAKQVHIETASPAGG